MPSTLAQSDIANIWSCALVAFVLFGCFVLLFSCFAFCAVVAFALSAFPPAHYDL